MSAGERKEAASEGGGAPGTTLIFLHVPKTGGTTLTRVLRRQYAPEDSYRVRANPPGESRALFAAMPEAERARMCLIHGHMPFGIHGDVPGPSTYLAMLREPVDRVVSNFYFILRNTKHRAHEAIRESGMDIPDVIRSGMLPLFDNGQVRLLSGVGADVPSGECGRDLLERAIRNVEEHFAVLGVMDRFDETLLLARRRFGWRGTFYRRQNVTRNRRRTAEFDPDTIELIREHNRLDAELYAWAAARFDAEVRALGPGFAITARMFGRANRTLARSPTVLLTRRMLGKLRGSVRRTSADESGRAR